MYIVHLMRRYTVAQARKNLATALDTAEHGEAVTIERRGVMFELRMRAWRRPKKRPPPLFEILDPAIEAGLWTWEWTHRGLAFRPRKSRRR